MGKIFSNDCLFNIVSNCDIFTEKDTRLIPTSPNMWFRTGTDYAFATASYIIMNNNRLVDMLRDKTDTYYLDCETMCIDTLNYTPNTATIEDLVNYIDRCHRFDDHHYGNMLYFSNYNKVVTLVCDNKLETDFDKSEMVAYANRSYCVDFERMPAIEMFLSQKNKNIKDILVMQNADTNTTFVFVKGKTDAVSYYHHLVGMMPVLFPRYFEANPANDSEKELLTAIAEEDVETFNRIVDDYISINDMIDAPIKRMITELETRYVTTERDKVQSDIDRTNAYISDLFDNISAQRRSLEDKYARLAYLMQSLIKDYDVAQSNLYNFVRKSKTVRIRNLNESGELSFDVVTELTNYDIDAFQKIIDNNNSYLYRFSSLDAELTRTLFQKIFIDCEYTIRVFARYKLNPSSYYHRCLSSRSEYTPSSDVSEYYENPHIKWYHCMGGADMEVAKALNNNDVILAINQCVVSASNFNVGDVCVAEHLCKELTKSDSEYRKKKILINNSTGELISPSELIDMLRKENANE